MAVEIFIGRHGQNEDNLNGILNGHRDLPLTDLGRFQGESLGMGIREIGLDFSAVYCSPLSRALETAEIVCRAAGLDMEPIVIPELIERDFGDLSGMMISELELLSSARTDLVKTETITYFLNPDGGETFHQAVERGQRVLERLNEDHQEGKVLLVCHGDIGKSIYIAATGKLLEDVLHDFHFGNGELIDLSSDGSAHVIQLPQHNL